MLRIQAERLFTTSGRDVQAQAARSASQFLRLNDSTLRTLDVESNLQYDGNRVDLVFRTGTTVGAVPLRSPSSGRMDYGLVVQPRFPWVGLGPVLDATGWRIIPQPLRLPLLPRSEANVPRWVLSAVILARVSALLAQLQRRFETVREVRSAPRGSVDWTAYALTSVPRGRFLDVPCRFPDLRGDTELRGGIRYVLDQQRTALSGQRASGAFVLRLISRCEELMEHVRDAPVRMPRRRQFDEWMRGSLRGPVVFDGLDAMRWSVEQRGLGGLSDLSGLPWTMPMDAFFESWCEVIAEDVARRIGGTVRSGRRRQTIAPLNWEPPFVGSQRFLLPDLMLSRGEQTIIVDAKYKPHWEEIERSGWHGVDDELRERHRADLLQALAYANLADSAQVMVCLAYPCHRGTWEHMRRNGRLFSRASLNAGRRLVDVMLTAFPMDVAVRDISREFARAVAGADGAARHDIMSA
ncbi:MAG: hypothetical protein HYX50_03945 [Chloroflexi bacterium]|nr:hypothetical protein [Chloroflexota bacterium]